MKLAWLSTVLLVGLAINVWAKEEEELHHFQDLDTGRQISARNGTIQGVQGVVNNVVADPIGQLMLAIGNLLGFVNNIDLANPIDINAINDKITNLNNINIGDLTGAAAGVGGAAAAGLGSVYALSSLKAALLSLILKPLDVANFVLAVIGLALLIVWLVANEGDIGGLFGDTGTGTLFRREGNDDYNNYYNYDSYSNYVSSARALLDTPFMQRVTTAVHDAIFKYD